MIPSASTLHTSIASLNIRSKFYAECLEYLKLRKDKDILEIEDVSFILEPLRLYFIYNLDALKLYSYLSDVIPISLPQNSYCYRKLELSTKDTDAISYHLGTQLQFVPKYYIISTKAITTPEYYSLLWNHNTISLFLGGESLKILKYYNLDNISLKSITKLKSLSDKLSIQDKEYFLVYSDFQLDIIGCPNNHEPKICGIFTPIKHSKDQLTRFNAIKSFTFVDYNYIFGEKSIKDKNYAPTSNYTRTWLFYNLANLAGRHNIYDIMFDPRYFYHYLGVKFISLDLLAAKFVSKSDPISYCNLILLKKYCSYDKVSICFPNLVASKNSVIVYDKFQINKIKKDLDALLRKSIDTKDISQYIDNITLCNANPFDIYSKRAMNTDFTFIISHFHNVVMKYFINKYFDKEQLLDIGAGPLKDISYYEEIGFKRLVAIEPSHVSVENGLERFKACKSIKLDYIEGVGDEKWDSEKYLRVMQSAPYKSILFKFTIHYMVKNFNILFKNLESIIDKNCTIIVSYIDCSEVGDKFEVFDEDIPVYGIYTPSSSEDSSEEYRKKLFFFRGVYGVENGSIEYAVNAEYLIKLFNNIGFNVILNKNFMEFTEPDIINKRKRYTPQHEKVTRIHRILVFNNF